MLAEEQGVEQSARVSWALLAYLGLLAAIIVAAAIGFHAGKLRATADTGIDPEEHRAIRVELRTAETELERVSGELEALRVRSEVDTASLELVRSELASQKERVLGLEEGLQFYRSLMSPGGATPGLSLRPLELVARARPGQFAFRVVAQQEGGRHPLLEGGISIEIFGEQEGLQVSYQLSELSDTIDTQVLELRFRYFQAIEGVLQLPEGFTPAYILLAAWAEKPEEVEVRERFPWQTQERMTYVGK